MWANVTYATVKSCGPSVQCRIGRAAHLRDFHGARPRAAARPQRRSCCAAAAQLPSAELRFCGGFGCACEVFGL